METAIDAAFNNLWKIPRGELLFIIIISLILFGIYWYIFHKKPLKEVVKDKVSEKIEPLKQVITDRDSKIKDLENDIQQLKDTNTKLMISNSSLTVKYDLLRDSTFGSQGPIKEYSKGE